MMRIHLVIFLLLLTFSGLVIAEEPNTSDSDSDFSDSNAIDNEYDYSDVSDLELNEPLSGLSEDDEEPPEDKPEDEAVLFEISNKEPWDYAAMRKYAGKSEKSELTEEERITLMYTNDQIASGGISTSLRDNWENFDAWSGKFKFYTKEEAQKLDMAYYVFSPIEKSALQLANNEKLLGGPGDLEQKYKDLLMKYELETSGREGRLLFEALDGLTDDEEAIRGILNGKSKGEMTILKKEYQTQMDLRKSKEGEGKAIISDWTKSCPGYDSCLQKILESSLSGGWKEMILDMYYVKPLKAMSHYFPLEDAWRTLIRKVKKQCRLAPTMPGCGAFTAVSAVDMAVDDAKEFYTEMIRDGAEEKSFGYYFAYFGAGVSSVLKSGTSIVDPHATVFEIQDAFTEMLWMLVGPLKIGKIAGQFRKAASATGRIMSLLGSKAIRGMRSLLFKLRKIQSSVMQSFSKLKRLVSRLKEKSKKFSLIAKRGFGKQREAAEIAASEFAQASEAANKAKRAAAAAEQTLARLRDRISPSSAKSTIKELKSHFETARTKISSYSRRRKALKEAAEGKDSTICKLMSSLIKDHDNDEDGMDLAGCGAKCKTKFTSMTRRASLNQGLQSKMALKLNDLKLDCIAACSAYFTKKTTQLKQQVIDYFQMRMVKEGKWYKDIITRWKGALDYQIVYSTDELSAASKKMRWSKFSCGHIR